MSTAPRGSSHRSSGRRCWPAPNWPMGSSAGPTRAAYRSCRAGQTERCMPPASTCTHMGGPLQEDTISDGCVTCPRPGSTFRFADGSIVRSPASTPQPSYQTPIAVGDGALIWHSPNLAPRWHRRLAVVSRPAHARLRLVARLLTRVAACSRDAMDRGSGARRLRRRETPRLPVQGGCRTTWTSGTVVDDGRLTHNPEVAGSNPAPATSFRSSRPSSSRERAFCVTGNVTKRGSGAVRRGLAGETDWHAVRQRGTR
jgi:riboflavin biosynthesis pyrimidine reductase